MAPRLPPSAGEEVLLSAVPGRWRPAPRATGSLPAALTGFLSFVGKSAGWDWLTLSLLIAFFIFIIEILVEFY